VRVKKFMDYLRKSRNFRDAHEIRKVPEIFIKMTGGSRSHRWIRRTWSALRMVRLMRSKLW